MTTQPLWLPAAPFRTHVQALIECSGLPWRAVALQARVPPAIVRTLVLGRQGRLRSKIPRQAAENLLRVSAAELDELRHEPASLDLLRRLVARLSSRGFTASDIATLLRTDTPRIRALIAGMRVPVDAYTALLARAACDALCPNDGEAAYDEPELIAA